MLHPAMTRKAQAAQFQIHTWGVDANRLFWAEGPLPTAGAGCAVPSVRACWLACLLLKAWARAVKAAFVGVLGLMLPMALGALSPARLVHAYCMCILRADNVHVACALCILHMHVHLACAYAC